MRIGVLSDTHISSPRETLPVALLKAFESVDLILHAGDWIDLCVLDQLRPLAEVRGVFGNMDRPAVRCTLPETLELDLCGFRVGLIHGFGPPSGIETRIAQKFNRPPDLIVYGHTHRPVFHKKGKTHFFNPGSPGDSGFTPRRTFGLLSLGEEIRGEILSVDPA